MAFFMKLSIQDEFYLFVEELQRYLSPHILLQLAQETDFVKRKRHSFGNFTKLPLAQLRLYWANQYPTLILYTRFLPLHSTLFLPKFPNSYKRQITWFVLILINTIYIMLTRVYFFTKLLY